MDTHHTFLLEAIKLSASNLDTQDGGPFGCVIVKDGTVIGRGRNAVISNHDPTAHAEMVAIRQACDHLGSHQLEGCILYSSCEPCPMCLGAIYWARPDAVYFANTRLEAAHIGFDDAFIYDQMGLGVEHRSIATHHLPMKEALQVFDAWLAKVDRPSY